jgi:hypothetical protein
MKKEAQKEREVLFFVVYQYMFVYLRETLSFLSTLSSYHMIFFLSRNIYCMSIFI